jgi:O-antigen/teichoic acid export membrane protein
MMGIFFNLSIWYKITNKTIYGAYIVCLGALVTVLVNCLFIPRFGFYASAWGHLISYSIMVIVTYFLGQKFFTIPYDLKRILFYILLAFVFYILSLSLDLSTLIEKYIINAVFITFYIVIFYLIEKKGYFKKLNNRINEN